MSSKDRHPLAGMRERAEALAEQLRPYCERLEIAGSIRRERPTIGDIELLAVPRLLPSSADLFALEDALDRFARERLAAGAWRPRLDKNGRAALGSRYKRLIVDGVPVDLFCNLPPAQFGLNFVIRTGSADFSRRFMTQRQHGGLLPPGFQVRDAGLYCGGRLLETPEEADVFAAVGAAYVEPAARE